MLRNGYTREFAEQTFAQIQGFGEYGFPESHSASFALLVYASAWMKRYHPAVFCCALLNSQPMGFYAPAQIVRDAREHGVEVRPVDVNASGWDCSLEEATEEGRATERRSDEATKWRKCMGTEWAGGSIGISADQGISRRACEANRRSERTRWTICIYRTISSDQDRSRCCRSKTRRGRCIWITRIFSPPLCVGFTSHYAMIHLPLFPPPSSLRRSVASSLLPPMPLGQEVMTDYSTAGLSLKKHPVVLVREILAGQRSSPHHR